MKTCGVFVIDAENNVLICHPTNHTFTPGSWSIPKGLPDGDEVYANAASRELFEETGMDIPVDELKPLPPVNYRKGNKILIPFFHKLNIKIDVSVLRCDSLVVTPEKSFPEVDEFLWVSMDRARVLLHEAQSKCIDLICNTDPCV